MATKEILATYSPEDVVVILQNSKFSHAISGYSEGGFLTVTRIVPHATLTNGADGSNARVVRAVKNCDVNLTLMQTSESNDVLTQLLSMDESTRDGSDVFSIYIKDNTGRTKMFSPAAFIGTNPENSYSEEINGREWVIHAINMEEHLGGNGRFTPDTQQTLTELGYTFEDRWRTSNSITP